MHNPNVIDEEYHFEGRAIVSETDTNGVITFANRKFCEISGYAPEELIGQPHNIIRHPDMPFSAFAQMWSEIQVGHTWHGLVKNLRKDGLYYWVETEVSPIFNDENIIIGYIAARKPAARKDIEEAKELYAKIRENENRE